MKAIMIAAALLLSACSATSVPVKVHKFSENQDSPRHEAAREISASSIIDDFLNSEDGKRFIDTIKDAKFD